MAVSEASTSRTKLGGYEFFTKVLGSPKYVVAPMVDQSELAWRRLSRKYGAQLVYTPMIHAKLFAEGQRKPYRDQNFNIPKGEEGGPGDRPLIVQFCANDPDLLLQAAKIVESHCDAVDINLGCPQEIAKKGHYGSFLQDEWELIHDMINILHKNLSVPVTAKFRVFPSVEKTVEYAKMLESAGAQILTCHGRIREQRGQKSGFADWEKIRAVKDAVSVPVIANGNIAFYDDIERCLAATGADAVMSAEGNLYNPAIFCSSASTSSAAAPAPTELKHWTMTQGNGVHLPSTRLALEYLHIVNELATPTAPSAVKGHLFKLLRPALARETDLRARLGKVPFVKNKIKDAYAKYEEIVKELEERMLRDVKAAEDMSTEELITTDPSFGLPVMPHWLAQPYLRPDQAVTAAKEAAPTVSTPSVEPAVVIMQEEGSTGKRAHSDRTPDPDEVTKRVKLSPEILVN